MHSTIKKTGKTELKSCFAFFINIALISDDKLKSSLIAGILNHISRKHIVTIPNCNKNLNILEYPEKSV